MDSAASDPVVEIRDLVAQRLGQKRFSLWFRNTTRFALTDGYLEVRVPNPFIGGWIESHFTDQIAEAAREVTGQDLRIAYSINPALMGNVKKDQLDRQAQSVSKGQCEPKRSHDRRVSPAQPCSARSRLDAFVVGPSNQMAYSAIRGVIDGPPDVYSSVFIHGGCGLGKTHLLQGLANALLEEYPHTRWGCMPGEEFTNRFLAALRSRKVDEFRRHLRGLDVLIIDDVHFLANKSHTQEEFLHTFNAIDAAGKRVVMASDAHPKLIGELSGSLVNRFVAGVVVKIDPPEFETRCEVLRRRAVQMNRDLPEPVIQYVAENLDTNVRELEGALLKLVAFSNVVDQPMTMGLVKRALAEHISRTRPIIRLGDIESVVATFFGLSPADLHTSRKARTIALARAIAMFLARKHTDLSFPEIGRSMGNKNHSTVILACRRMSKILDEKGTVCWRTPTGKSEMPLSSLLEGLEEQLAR